MSSSAVLTELEVPRTLCSLTEKTIEDLRQYGHSVEDIDFLIDHPTYPEFFEKFLLPNKLCVLSSQVTEKWRSRHDWVDENGKPNFTFLKKFFGDAVVPVADCGEEKYSSHCKQEMTMAEYIEYWKTYSTNGYPKEEKCLYLKDWHFTRDFPDYHAYDWPIFFKSDWLNEYWDMKSDIKDDYRFVYMGPKGSWTPFHSDVLRSYSWSANICGKKKWIFFPPGEEVNLKDKFGNLVYDLTNDKINDGENYPKLNNVKKKFIIYQNPGEVVFVPSGWHHQVFNMEDTISINHNWMNGCNIDLCWKFIKMSLEDVKKEIQDCESMGGWADQCQLILKASSGIDYSEFFEFLCVIADNRFRRVHQILEDSKNKFQEYLCSGDHSEQGYECSDFRCEKTLGNISEFLTSSLGLNHCMFDLDRVKTILEDMTLNTDFLETFEKKCDRSPRDIISRIAFTLHETQS